jgi:molecular chaperone GrpE
MVEVVVSTESKHEELQEEAQPVTDDAPASDEALAEIQDDKSIEEQLELALAESADLRDKVLRVAAEFENYKKRMERERATMLKYAGEHIFRELLPVVDNLERAVSQGIVAGLEPVKNLEALREGVQLTLKNLLTVLDKFEVKPIASTGQPFDPNEHEALTMEPSDTIPANHVISEFEKGYHYKDRLLRASRVVVSSGAAGQT